MSELRRERRHCFWAVETFSEVWLAQLSDGIGQVLILWACWQP